MQNKWVTEARGERNQARAKLTPFADDLMGGPGYSADEQSAITGNALEAGDQAFNAAEQGIARRASRTGNDAGSFANLVELGRERARHKSDTSRDLTRAFADEKMRRRLAGAQLSANLYGVDTNLLGNIAGLPLGSIQAGNQAIGRWSGPFGFGGG
jgi:hypothetical protein